MQGRKLDIELFRDRHAAERGEPGIVHSYMKMLATALAAMGDENGPAWWMGASGFAFRIWTSDTLCPSAMSMFDFKRILPQAIEQLGYKATYISHKWDDDGGGGDDDATYDLAHETIIKSIERGVPAVVWDLHDTEWGLVTGYDPERSAYVTLAHNGREASLPYASLGRNGIDVLAVSIPGEPNGLTREKAIQKSLQIAVNHSSQNEWADRPDYQNGLAAFDQWALVFERWGLLLDAGKANDIGLPVHEHAAYYAAHYYSARCYARAYLDAISEYDTDLMHAASLYARVADQLRLLWKEAPTSPNPNRQSIDDFVQRLQHAKRHEAEAVEALKAWLGVKV